MLASELSAIASPDINESIINAAKMPAIKLFEFLCLIFLPPVKINIYIGYFPILTYTFNYICGSE